MIPLKCIYEAVLIALLDSRKEVIRLDFFSEVENNRFGMDTETNVLL